LVQYVRQLHAQAATRCILGEIVFCVLSPMTSSSWMRDSGGCALTSGGGCSFISMRCSVVAPQPKQESSSEEEEEDEAWQSVAADAVSKTDSDSKGSMGSEKCLGHIAEVGCAPHSEIGTCPDSPSVSNVTARAPTSAPTSAPVASAMVVEKSEEDEESAEAEECSEEKEREEELEDEEEEEEEGDDVEYKREQQQQHNQDLRKNHYKDEGGQDEQDEDEDDNPDDMREFSGRARLAELASGEDRARWVYNDGGRAAAGFLGKTGDCFTRAVAIASCRSYQEVYTFVNRVAKEIKEHGDAAITHNQRSAQKKIMRDRLRYRSMGAARRGVAKPAYDEVMHRMGWVWTATMAWGTGCKTHLKSEDLPSGCLVCRVTKHMVAVIDGILHDTYDASRGGTRCVYGYFSPGPNSSASVPLASLLALAVVARSAAPCLDHARRTPQKAHLPSQVIPIDDGPVEDLSQRKKRRTPKYGRATLARQIWLGFSDDDSNEEVRYRSKRRKAQQQLLHYCSA